MKHVSLTVNGKSVAGVVEPRLHLADFLREHQYLTATHIGCEHGVCGACTVLLDGASARSCLTFTVAAEGASVTTLEGFEDDHVMNVLRENFAKHHGLQCGFCTPGMLMTSRDIVTRLPDADERRIRLELSGNLCRCTGYVGIVEAVQGTLAALKSSGYAHDAVARVIGPVGSHPPANPTDFSTITRRDVPRSDPPPRAAVETPAVAQNVDAIDWTSVERNGTELRQSFPVSFPRETVWRFFADLDQVVGCMPGARLTAPFDGRRAEGEVGVKLGPITSAFRGVLDVERDDGTFRGIARGAGRDTKSASNARAIITYEVQEKGADASQVDVAVRFLLSGALAQFSRSGLVKDVADHLTRLFAGNLEARLSGRSPITDTTETLDAGALARSALWSRVRGWLRRLTGG